jgi:hypothetical protein
MSSMQAAVQIEIFRFLVSVPLCLMIQSLFYNNEIWVSTLLLDSVITQLTQSKLYCHKIFHLIHSEKVFCKSVHIM